MNKAQNQVVTTTSSGSDAKLSNLLKQYFGYDSFRPLQRDIIEDSLNGQDVFALLPTGGGKSICFQLPALIRPGLTLVVSPLIALMKDQVEALQSAGIMATFLNSSLDESEARTRLRELYNGKYKLLYAAPERLLMPEFMERLESWNISALAIDEAHCISEWGHDFRPEYRRLTEIREKFPTISVTAFTATATNRVREDIINGLALRNPQLYVASFDRPNISYRVEAKEKPYQKLLKFLQSKPDESGIVYCQSRKNAEKLALNLEEDGIPARAYHAGLTQDERAENQDLFLRDEVRVICATVAFGMGINKPNVRFVVHYDLPKNIEGYYQETGRAGRDGLPSECLLLFNSSDVAKYQHFIAELAEEKQRKIAQAQLQQMVHYAESSQCRRKSLLSYFGETYKNSECDNCDNCLTPKETFNGAIEARKFLACIYRINEKSGFSTGMHHVVEVLTGAQSEKIKQWGHQQLSTYGIGKELSRNQWLAIGRELIRLGLIRQNVERFNVLEICESGMLALKSKDEITLTRPPTAKTDKKPRNLKQGEETYDTTLFEVLRRLRKQIADSKHVPPYIIFGDVSLRQMARERPTDKKSFAEISGVGEKKLKDFAKQFTGAIKEYLSNK
jgi:ATP-dependent DNA helicase RecQ